MLLRTNDHTLTKLGIGTKREPLLSREPEAMIGMVYRHIPGPSVRDPFEDFQDEVT